MRLRYGYSPSQAGEEMLKFCIKARKELISKLVKPPLHDEEAFEAYVMEKIRITNMSYDELVKEVKNARMVQPV